MRSTRLLALVPVFAFGLSGAEAGDFSWNRKVVDLTTVPASGGPPGTHDIVVGWSFELGGEGMVADLGTEAQVSWTAAPESDTSDDSRTIVFGPTAVEPESFGRIKGGYR